VLSTLLERHLIKIVGRKNVVGRPFLYATTKEFLIRFGLNDLTDLPKIEDMAEALGFDPPARLIEQTPAEEMLPLREEGEESGEVEEVEEVEKVSFKYAWGTSPRACKPLNSNQKPSVTSKMKIGAEVERYHDRAETRDCHDRRRDDGNQQRREEAQAGQRPRDVA